MPRINHKPSFGLQLVPTPRELEQALNDFAQQGWELVSITPSGWRELEDFQLEVIRYRAVFKS